MIIAISDWDGRISPLFDASDRLQLIEIRNHRERGRKSIVLENRHPFARAKQLSEQNVDVLICGAISRTLEAAVTGAGIQVYGFICGETEAVRQAYLKKRLNEVSFHMPGYRRNLLRNAGAGR